jgi:putative transcriptional regulator
MIKNKIRELRIFSDEMTHKELAELVDVTRQTIMAIEKSKHSPTLFIQLRLANWLKQ